MTAKWQRCWKCQLVRFGATIQMDFEENVKNYTDEIFIANRIEGGQGNFVRG